MATGFFGGRDLKSHFFQAKASTFVGLAQSGSNSINLPAGAQVGDLALFYGCENTSATASGTQAIASGPAGWTVLTGTQGSTAQVSTAPVFLTRAIWWKKLVAADIAVANGGTGTGVVSFTIGTLGVASACGVMVFRGGTQFNGTAFNTMDSRVSQNFTAPAKIAGCKLVIFMNCLRADLAEVITKPAAFTSAYPGVMFAGAFFFCDPNSYVVGSIISTSWTTSSGGSNQVVMVT